MNRYDQAQVLLAEKVIRLVGDEVAQLEGEGFTRREAIGVVLSAHLAACCTALQRTGLTLDAVRAGLVAAIGTARPMPRGVG